MQGRLINELNAGLQGLDLLQRRKELYKENISYYRPWILLITDGFVDAVFRTCLYAFLLGRSLPRREIAMPKRLGLLWVLSLYLSAG